MPRHGQVESKHSSVSAQSGHSAKPARARQGHGQVQEPAVECSADCRAARRPVASEQIPQRGAVRCGSHSGRLLLYMADMSVWRGRAASQHGHGSHPVDSGATGRWVWDLPSTDAACISAMTPPWAVQVLSGSRDGQELQEPAKLYTEFRFGREQRESRGRGGRKQVRWSSQLGC